MPGSSAWKFVALKIACCGSPLLLLLIASGAVAIVDLATGVTAVALVAAGWVLWRRRRACAREVPQQAQQSSHRHAGGRHSRAGDVKQSPSTAPLVKHREPH